MEQTARLQLPLLAAEQAQKHVTVNEALILLDLLSGVVPVISRALSAPPAEPVAEGAVYLLAAGGSGGWAGFGAGNLALRIDGAWRRAVPSEGMVAGIGDEAGTLIRFSAGAWHAIGAGGQSRRVRAVVIGDSVSAWTPGIAGDNLWWVWANALTGWSFDVAGVSAAPGRTCQDALDSFGEVQALREEGPLDEAWVLLGQNDIETAASAAAGLASLDALIARLVAIGTTTIRVLTVHPRLAAEMSPDLQAGLITFDSGLATRARFGLIQVIDAGAALRDVTEVDGRAEPTLMADNRHPNARGALRMGQCFADAIEGDYLPLHDFPIGAADSVALNSASTQLLVNPMLTGSGGTNNGGATGTLPAGYAIGFAGAAISGLVSYSEETRPRRRRWMDIGFSGAIGANKTFTALQQFVENVGTKGVTPGVSKIRARGSVKGAGLPASFAGVSLFLQGYTEDWSAATLNYSCLTESTTVLGEFPDDELCLEIPATLVPPGTAHIGMFLDVRFAAGTCSGTISVSEPQLRVVD